MKVSVVGAFDAKTHLPKLLEAVLNGERITITRRGVAVAMLVPVESETRTDVASVIADFKKWRQGITWGKNDMTIHDAKQQGRK